MFPAYAYLSAYDRHKKLINDYLLLKGETVTSLKRDTYLSVSNYEKLDHNIINLKQLLTFRPVFRGPEIRETMMLSKRIINFCGMRMKTNLVHGKLD